MLTFCLLITCFAFNSAFLEGWGECKADASQWCLAVLGHSLFKKALGIAGCPLLFLLDSILACTIVALRIDTLVPLVSRVSTNF